MRIIQKEVYKFEDLSEEVQNTIINSWRDKGTFFMGEEIEATIKALSLFCRVDLSSWEYSQFNYHYRITSSENLERPAYRVVDALLDLIKYEKYGRKCYYKDINHVRKSKIWTIQLDNCPFTGMCYDYAFTDAVKELYKPENFFAWTYVDFVTQVFNNLFGMAQKDYAYWLSEECIKEDIELGEYEFFANGDSVL